jgi:NodT family efflux transporter outer membrane factor (OMF) lipoprotein
VTNLNVAWEMDVWGRLRDQRNAARSEATALAEDEHFARLSVAAALVSAAFTLAEANGQIRISEENVQALRTQLQVLNKQMERGLNAERGALDISLSQSDLGRAEATVQARRREADGGRRALEVLMGGYPGGKVDGINALPEANTPVPAGLPSELLLRRPDLRAAERRLASAVSTEGAARKAFLPGIRLTSGGGFSSAELAKLLSKEALLWSLAGSVTQNLFQGGRLAANVDAARARYDQALERYAQSALVAFQEVETALAADRYWRAQEEALLRASTEAARAEELARTSYERGLSDILTLLDSRRRAFDATSALLTARAARLRNRVDLHLALGGEF